jgi:hypothetical protein
MEAAACIAKQPTERRKLLTAIHEAIIRYDKSVSTIVELMTGKEMISYHAPGTFKYGLSSVKNYMSLHVLPMYGFPALHEKYKNLLPLAAFQKGCINFENEKQIPLGIVRDLIHDCSAIDLAALKKQFEKSKAKKVKEK